MASSGSPVSARRHDLGGGRNAIRASTQPVPAPTTTPMTVFPISSQPTQRSPQEENPPREARKIAAYTKGNASPSLSPASEVSANRTSSFSSISSAWLSSSMSALGPSTWTSAARTGSVGASTAATSTAAGAASPITHQPSSAVAPMASGIPTSSSRQVDAQARQVAQ